MSSYTLATWLYANLLYPLIFFLYMGWTSDDILSGVGLYFPFLFFSFLLSLPSLIFSYLLMRGMTALKASADWKFIVWLAGAPFIVIANFFILRFLLFKGDVGGEDFWSIVTPAMIAVIIIILLRFKLFYTALIKLQSIQQQNERYEKN